MLPPGLSLGSLAALLVLSPAALSVPPASPLPEGAAADLVLVGGKVWPGKALPLAAALAVKNGRVVALGSEIEVLAWRGPFTRVVDLAGRLVVPGFNDAHVHFLSGGTALLSVDLRTAPDEAGMARLVGERARTLAPGQWVLEGNWDHESWPVKRLPTRASLDPVTPANPVFVQRLDGHMGIANSLALRLAGISRATFDPPGGTIVRDADGEPTGILKDNAMDLLTRVVPHPDPARNLEAARAAMREAARFGVTSVQDNSGTAALRTYLGLETRGELTVRVSAWQNASSIGPLVVAGITGNVGDDWVRIGAVKVLLDGSMGAGTAAFFAPYADDPDTNGLLLYPVAEMEDLLKKADGGGFPVAVHAIGDRANALVLDAFGKVGAKDPASRRFRIEHAQVVRAKDLARWQALGVIASVQPSHAADDLRWGRKRIGAARLGDAYRLRSFLDRGIPVAFGTDWPVESLDPRIGLYAAVTRKAPPGVAPEDWNPAERITLEDALDLYTRGSAFAEFREKEKGTLAPGMLADFVVLGSDLLALGERDPRSILSVPVELTVVGGRVVFESARRKRPASGPSEHPPDGRPGVGLHRQVIPKVGREALTREDLEGPHQGSEESPDIEEYDRFLVKAELAPR